MFPSILNTFNIVNLTDRLNNPSHSTLHNSVGSVLTQVETVIGVDGVNSVVGTMMYDLRSPASKGGGHVQGAAFGGTGQTSFIKGDLLIATSASVISKLAIGADNQVLVASSVTSTGVVWATPNTTKITTNTSILTIFASPETSIITVTIPGSTLGINNAIRATAYINNYRAAGSSSVVLKAIYAGGTVASVIIRNTATTASASTFGTIEYTLFANNSASLQRGMLKVNIYGVKDDPATNSSSLSVFMYDRNISSVESTLNQSFGIVSKGSTNNTTSLYDVDGVIVEKIV